MKILIVRAEQGKCILVRMEGKDCIEELKRLIAKKERAAAIVRVLSGGTIVRILRAEEFPFVDADLMLTKDGAYWNLI